MLTPGDHQIGMKHETNNNTDDEAEDGVSEIGNDEIEGTLKQPSTQTSTTVYGQSTHYFTQQQQQQQPAGLVSLSGISSTTTTSSSISFNGSMNGGYQQYHYQPKQCVSSFTQPVDEWSCESVAQWLAINDLAAYIDSFLDKSINGEKLIAMDTSKLKVRMIKEIL